MKRTALAILTSSCLLACGAERNEATLNEPEQATPPEAEPYPEGAMMSGRKTYDEFCASCHDTGIDEAPVIGQPDAWKNRSPLWQAVLMEHAKQGYLDMPAKGGADELSDLAVSQAVEYMLLTTFPEKSPD